MLDALVVSDDSLTLKERDALHQFSKLGIIRFVDVVSVPLLLNSTKAAELLGVSPETFKKVRDQAAIVGVEELCGVEITPGNIMFSRIELVRFSQGEFFLTWSSTTRPNQLMASESISIASARREQTG